MKSSELQMIKCYNYIICEEVLNIKTYVINDFGRFCKLEAKRGKVAPIHKVPLQWETPPLLILSTLT